MDFVKLNKDQMKWTIPELAPLLHVSSRHQRGSLAYDVGIYAHQLHIHGECLLESGVNPGPEAKTLPLGHLNLESVEDKSDKSLLKFP
ncbi:hypothetical protein AVEN_158357-1 [Araneus ventricosus]|uniref:Uncharacterized protein n=1 Tax=Araneus ventricosus TaxID=182803 RepID=A0A4Y2F9W6_ARAVE|nr:hypothetical protein AVEN_158357-1 [Araneus ventricosus]